MAIVNQNRRQSVPAYINIIAMGALAWGSYTISMIVLICGISDAGLLAFVNGLAVLIMGVVTIIHVSLTIYLFKKSNEQQSVLTGTNEVRRIRSICDRLNGLLPVGWIFPAGLGLVVVARRPVCLSSEIKVISISQRSIRCYYYQIMVALSILMLLATSSFFYLLELRARTAIPKRINKQEIGKPFVSHSSTGSEISYTLGHEESGREHSPYHRASQAEHQQWLQRKNSLSSQRAIYPYKYRVYPQQGCRRTGSTLSRLHSVSEIGETGVVYKESSCPSSLECSSLTVSSSSNSSWSYGLSDSKSCTSMSVISRSPERYTGSGSVRTLQPSKSRSTTVKIVPEERANSPPPPSWCPSSLRQSPLSTDPMIRALSFSSDNNWVQSPSQNLHAPDKISDVSLIRNDLKSSCTSPSLATTCMNSTLRKKGSLSTLARPNLTFPTANIAAPSTSASENTTILQSLQTPNHGANHPTTFLKRPEPVQQGRSAYQRVHRMRRPTYSLLPSLGGPGIV